MCGDGRRLAPLLQTSELSMTDPESSEKGNGLWRQLPRAWFFLTPNERLSIAVILGLFLLGLGVRWWHLSHEKSEDIVQSSAVSGQPARHSALATAGSQ